jgi:PKD domain
VRALATSLVFLAALLALPASALASDQIQVEPEGSSARTVTLSGLGEPDVQAREYTVDDGTGERRVPITGFSLDEVLGAANVDPYRFADVRVAASAGPFVTIDRSEVTRSGAFPEGPPVFWMEGGEARFLRPASAAGGSVLVSGGALTVTLSRQSELQVTASASPRRVKTGEPVTFTAAVSGAGDEPVDLNWYFDDGGQASGARVTHRFRRPGTYDVLVGATTASDETGADHTISVQVGKARRGPNRKGGGTNPDANAPDSGAATGSAGGGSGSGGSGGSGGSSGTGDAAPADEGAGGGAGDRSRERARRREARRRAAARREARREAAEARERREEGDASASRQVSGIELADLSALSSEAGRDALQAARRGRLREDQEDSGAGIPAAVWWTLGLTGLLGLGAWREARSGPAGRPA